MIKRRVPGETTEHLTNKITDIAYDVFAYRLGPDEWEESFLEFYEMVRKCLEETEGGK